MIDAATPHSGDGHAGLRGGRRSARTTVLATLVSVSLVLAACSGGADTAAVAPDGGFGATASSPAEVDADSGESELVSKGGDEVEAVLTGDATLSPTAPGSGETDEATAERLRSSVADDIQFLGNTVGLPGGDGADPVPVGIDLPSIGVDDAPVTSVGVEPNGDMEIPGAEEVGWYRFGPNPGDTGSAVLAAHIAFNGDDGVFRNLADMEPGERFSVAFSDGSEREFVVIGLRQYSKETIPLEDFFARDGTPRLILITCGGSFNRSLNSYDDNVVVISVPLDFLEAT